MNAEATKVRLEAVLIETARPETLAEFYRSAFDLEEPRNSGPDHLGMDLENTYLGFDRVSGAGGENQAPVQLWFQVEDVEGQFMRMVRLGARVKYAPESESSAGEVLAMVFDPDGNQVGLVGPTGPDQAN